MIDPLNDQLLVEQYTDTWRSCSLLVWVHSQRVITLSEMASDDCELVAFLHLRWHSTRAKPITIPYH